MRWTGGRGKGEGMLMVVTMVFICCVGGALGKISTRCYSCRSRGDLGDCKDPFSANASSAGEIPGRPVSLTICPSGWCRKQVEGIRGPGDDFGAATERACMPQSPLDGEERCAEVTIRNKVTLLCVCRGDLCNPAQITKASNIFTLLLVPLLVVLVY